MQRRKLQQNDMLSYPYAADKLLLYQKKTRTLAVLNETAQFLWELLEQDSSVQDIITAFSRRYEIPKTLAAKDVTACLETWSRNGFLASDDTPEKESGDSLQQSPAPIPETISTPIPGIHHQQEFLLADVRFQLGFGDLSLAKDLLNILGHFQTNAQSVPDLKISIHQNKHTYYVTLNGQVYHETQDQDEAIFRVVYELVEHTYKERDCLAVLHGGAVAKDSHCFIFPGSQGSGKSTLVAALQSQGFEYLSDDVCPIVDEQLIPVPMSQTLKQGSWEALKEYRPELQEQAVRRRLGRDVRYLPPISGSRAAWDRHWSVSAFIFPEYTPDSQFCCRPLDPLESLQHLIHSDSIFSERLPNLLAWVELVPAYSLHYQSLQQAITAVEQLTFSTAAPHCRI